MDAFPGMTIIIMYGCPETQSLGPGLLERYLVTKEGGSTEWTFRELMFTPLALAFVISVVG
jgi:hypothetical protein